MIRFWRKALLPLCIAVPAFLVSAQESTNPVLEVLEEVVVTGRQPGPPLWKVSSGGNVLWILPLIDMYPKKMEWDSTRVESIIAESQEYIERPVALRMISTSNLVAVMRAMRMSRKAAQLPDGETLADALPAELYQRFLALKARYFPGNSKIENLDVGVAARVMQQEILDREGLEMLHHSRVDSPLPITSKLQKWLKANKTIRRTSPGAVVARTISSADLKTMRKMLEDASTPVDVREWQIACLESAIAYFEKDLEPVKRRANAWALGHVDDLISPTPLYGGSASCRTPPMVPEGVPALEALRKDNPELVAFLTEDRTAQVRESKERWLEAAEAALARNASTFGVLPVEDILDEGGLVEQLRAKGYAVDISAE